MTFSDNATMGRSAEYYVGCKKGRWTGLNIGVMVAGFVFFWPAGLVILYWILQGRDVRDLPAAARQKWVQFRGGSYGRTDNVIFNEYQQTQYDRIKEIQDEIDRRSKDFEAYRSQAKRRADEKEFSQFMANAPGQPG